MIDEGLVVISRLVVFSTVLDTFKFVKNGTVTR
jgi:hypothetical protein